MRTKYAVVTVYNDGDGFRPLAHVVSLHGTLKAAKNAAYKLAEKLLKAYNTPDDLDEDDKKFFDEHVLDFDTVWGEVDNKETGYMMDWGFDPLEDTIDERIRVVAFETKEKKHA